ncbi:MAG: T9SS type A sorting domain-containing protein [Ignavibacteriaceae bacterium]|nr:T9SS type A sorting domain-containing protein [Ignavibacteriaceae bacterium]
MFNYDKQGYEVSLEGIGTNREVYLRLSTLSNDETSGYSLTQRYSDETILGKTHTKKINYTGTEKPTEYALYQNYPNPFNPTTTITYQIPKEGLVTLKIYDILGKEVTTLINEEKQAGKYSIEFNASKISSGVYLYELRSNEYKSTKKLMLMK